MCTATGTCHLREPVVHSTLPQSAKRTRGCHPDPESRFEFEPHRQCDFGAFASGAWTLAPWLCFSSWRMNTGQPGPGKEVPGTAWAARLPMNGRCRPLHAPQQSCSFP